MSKLIFTNVKKVYDGNVCAVKDFNLEVDDNEFIVLVGPSGCGKSTLLRMIAGLEEISGGTISVDGKIINNLAPSDRNIAMVFQNYALFGNMTVYDNIGFSKIIKRSESDEIYDVVTQASKIVDLEEYLKRYPGQLSGGQRQRVALGRALVKNSGLLLMDEPLSNLDAKLRAQTRKEIAKLHKTLKSTIVYVTHDQVEAMAMASRIVILRDGYVMQIGTPRDVYHFPANIFVSQFIGTYPTNLLKGTLEGKFFKVDKQKIELDESQLEKLKPHMNRSILLGFRAETVKVADKGIILKVEATEYLGSQVIVKGTIDNSKVVVVLDGNTDTDVHELQLALDTKRFSFFDEETEERI